MRHVRRRQPGGFTLVELLVVIGIIALLVSILLPALSAARRQGRSIKCMAALREIGRGFYMYSNENKGYWPVAVHSYGHPKFPLNSPSEEYRWSDLIARYITSQSNMKYDDVNKVRQNSVLWGCPEWAKAIDADDTNFTDKVRTGYGMQYCPKGNLSVLTYISSSGDAADGSIVRRYARQIEWTKPTDRGLITEAVTHIVNFPTSISETTTWYPVRPGEPATPTFYVDGARHAPPGTTRAKEYVVPFMNMLYCDGHVAPVSVKEAWKCLYNP